MPPSFFRSFGDDAHRRSVSLTHSAAFPGASGLSSANVGEDHHHGRLVSKLAEREWTAVKPVLTFALEVAVGAVASAGTILAIFAWSGASL
jgi:hypothetical protein